jgi:hypothetical protein
LDKEKIIGRWACSNPETFKSCPLVITALNAKSIACSLLVGRGTVPCREEKRGQKDGVERLRSEPAKVSWALLLRDTVT